MSNLLFSLIPVLGIVLPEAGRPRQAPRPGVRECGTHSGSPRPSGQRASSCRLQIMGGCQIFFFHLSRSWASSCQRPGGLGRLPGQACENVAPIAAPRALRGSERRRVAYRIIHRAGGFSKGILRSIGRCGTSGPFVPTAGSAGRARGRRRGRGRGRGGEGRWGYGDVRWRLAAKRGRKMAGWARYGPGRPSSRTCAPRKGASSSVARRNRSYPIGRKELTRLLPWADGRWYICVCGAQVRQKG